MGHAEPQATRAASIVECCHRSIAFGQPTAWLIIRGSHRRLSGRRWPRLGCTVRGPEDPRRVRNVIRVGGLGFGLPADRLTGGILLRLPPSLMAWCLPSRSIVARHRWIRGDRFGVQSKQCDDVGVVHQGLGLTSGTEEGRQSCRSLIRAQAHDLMGVEDREQSIVSTLPTRAVITGSERRIACRDRR